MATHSGKCVKLDIYANEMGGIDTVTSRLNSKDTASALYRSITEHHAFYRCDSMRPAVKTQVSKKTYLIHFEVSKRLSESYYQS